MDLDMFIPAFHYLNGYYRRYLSIQPAFKNITVKSKILK
jgi:hypothetical protein